MVQKVADISTGWIDRLRAAAIHFAVTLCIAASAATLIFFAWFPGSFAEMVGGIKLLLLVVASDIILGPLISLVIFNRMKSRKELITDYAIVGSIQLVALLYGFFAVSVSRPVFVAFVFDRFEVVTRVELDDADLSQAKDPEYRSASWFGPKLIYVELPTDLNERNDLVFSAAAGKDAQLMPKYYRSYEQGIDQVKGKAKSVDMLFSEHPEKAKEMEQAIAKLGYPKARLLWLPVHHRFGFWTAIIDAQTGNPLKYLPIDPY